MNRFLLLITVFTTAMFQAGAQCPGCAMNMSYTSPGIYPNILPNGTQNQPYDEDVTFVMFTDTMGFAVNYFKITSVSGLPLGLNAECSNASNGCVYNPQTSIYGCVKVCGTPIQAGTFTIAVGVTANLQVVGNQNSVINIPLTITPASGSNSDFSFSPATACDSANVTFEALLNNPNYINTYSWDFGNGAVSNLKNPPVQHYDSAGTYTVTLQTQFSVLSISKFTVSSVNNNWCGDVEEPNLPLLGCQGAPDLFVVITDANSNTVYTSPTINDVFSATWNNLNIPLTNPPYSFTIWDEDVISPNDNLGTFIINPNTTGTFNYSGAGGTSGSYEVATQVVTTFNSSDSIIVYPVPQQPIVSVLGNDTICSGDSVLLKAWSADAIAYNWYASDELIAGANDSLFNVHSTNLYKAEVLNAHGCNAFSETVLIVQQPPLPPVNFTVNGNTLITFLSDYHFQWILNGEDILGATNSTYSITQQGSYSLRACDDFGCCRISDALLLTPVSVSSMNELNGVVVYPNPASSVLNIGMTGTKGSVNIELFDLTGRVVLSTSIGHSVALDLSNLMNGTYILRLTAEQGMMNQRIVIEH